MPRAASIFQRDGKPRQLIEPTAYPGLSLLPGDTSLRGLPDVTVREETDIRDIRPGLFGEPPALAVIDVSFISLKLVLPAVTALVAPDACLVALIKPQFEAGRAHLKKGVVRDAGVQEAVCGDIGVSARTLGWHVLDIIPSPIAGGDGNKEFLLGAVRTQQQI